MRSACSRTVVQAWRFWKAAGIPLASAQRRSNSSFSSGCLRVRTQPLTQPSAASWRVLSAPVELAGVPSSSRSMAAWMAAPGHASEVRRLITHGAGLKSTPGGQNGCKNPKSVRTHTQQQDHQSVRGQVGNPGGGAGRRVALHGITPTRSLRPARQGTSRRVLHRCAGRATWSARCAGSAGNASAPERGP